MRGLVVLGAALIALASAAHAADLPQQFQGLWVSAEVPNKDKCRKDEPKGEEDRPVDSMMGVTGGTITWYEMQCTVQSSKLQHAPTREPKERITLDVNLACKGEGELWSSRQIWHFETIDGKPVLAVTDLTQTNYRDERGKKLKVTGRVIASIYFACRQS